MASGTPDPAGSHDLSKLDELMVNLHANLTMGIKMFLSLRDEVEAVKLSKVALEHEMDRVMDKNNKLTQIATENARMAQHKQDRNRELKADLLELRLRLAHLENHGSGSKDEESSAMGEDHDGLEEDITEICSSQEHPRERKSSKLSRPRTRSKVRYQDIPPGQSTSPPFMLSKPSPETTGSDGGAMSGSSLSVDKPSQQPRGSDGTAMSGSQRSAKSGSANYQSKESYRQATEVDSCPSSSVYKRKLPRGSAIRTSANVLVPDTEMVGDDSDDDPGEDYQIEDKEGNYWRTKDYRSVLHVPETVPPDNEMFSPIQPDGRSHGRATKSRTDRNYSGNLIPLEQSTPSLDGPPDVASRMLQDTGRSASPLLLRAARDKSRRSIPPSESQLFVDFSRTQMSPTFDGADGRSTPDRPTSSKQRHSCEAQTNFAAEVYDKETDTLGRSKENNLDSTPGQRKEKKKPIIWAITSRSEASPNVPTDTRTPNLSTDTVKSPTSPAYDESGQSEASFLILQHPSQLKAKSQTAQSSGQSSGHSQDRKSKHDSESRPKRRLSDGVADNEVYSTKRKKTVSSDINEEEDHFEEQCIPDGDVGSQRHLSKEREQSTSERFLKDRSSHTSNLDVKPDLSNMSKMSKNSKHLVQMKLTKDSFRSTVSPSHQMQRKFNGGQRVYVDSQDDPYIQKALQESMQTADAHYHQPREGTSSDFKVPMIPKGVHKSGKNKDVQHHISDDSFDRDLNGSIDPAIELSLLDDNTEIEPNDNKENRGQRDASGNVSSRRSEAAGNIKSSSEHPTREQRHSFEGDGDGEPTFMDDSIADMFDDEDKDKSIAKEQNQNLEGSTLRKEIKSEAVDDQFHQEARADIYQGMDEDQNSLARNFDSPPKKEEPPAYKFKDVVRKRDERQKLKGFDCQECAGYYGGLGLTADEIALRTKNCSRHRGHYSPPSTPEHYWSIDFPDTPTCVQRGYIKDPGAVEEEPVPRRKRKMRYRHNFGKTKQDGPS